MSTSDSHQIDAKKAMFAGALWTVAMRWGGKFLGLISTIIVARLVLPEDFAVIAMAMLVVGLLEAFIDLGAATALMRQPTPSKAFIDSAWTMRLAQCVCLSLLLISLAYPASEYFEEPKLVEVIWVLAFCTSLTGCNNIGLVLARKALNFSLDFRLMLCSKVLQVLATIVAAHYFGDYRALVVGVFVGYVSATSLSYLMHPYRPGFNTQAWPQIWHFSKWLVLANTAGYLLQKLDQIVAGRMANSHVFGLYNVGSDIGELPTSQLGPAILKSLLPVLSSIQDDLQRVNRGVLKVMAILNSLTLPAGFGTAAIAEPLGLLLLGPSWQGATPFIALFAICSALKVAPKPLSSLLILRGHSKNQSSILWLELASFVIAALILVPSFDIFGLVYARIFAAAIIILAFCYQVHIKCQLPWLAPIIYFLRPLLLSAVMFTLIQFTLGAFNTDNLWLQLITGISTGALSYTVMMLFSWLVCGRPEGLEAEVTTWYQKRKTKVLGHANKE